MKVNNWGDILKVAIDIAGEVVKARRKAEGRVQTLELSRDKDGTWKYVKRIVKDGKLR